MGDGGCNRRRRGLQPWVTGAAAVDCLALVSLALACPGEQVVQRSEAGLDFGVILIPEGLIDFVPEVFFG